MADTNSADQIISFGEDLESNTLNTFDYCQDLDSCHTLFIFDEYNDGICCDFGNGYIQINQQLLVEHLTHKSKLTYAPSVQFLILTKNGDISIYPNPTKEN